MISLITKKLLVLSPLATEANKSVFIKSERRQSGEEMNHLYRKVEEVTRLYRKVVDLPMS